MKKQRQKTQNTVDNFDTRITDKRVLAKLRKDVQWLADQLGGFRALADTYARPKRIAGWFCSVARGSSAPRVDGIDVLMVNALVASVKATSKASKLELYHIEEARKSAAQALYHATAAAQSIARRRGVKVE